MLFTQLTISLSSLSDSTIIGCFFGLPGPFLFLPCQEEHNIHVKNTAVVLYDAVLCHTDNIEKLRIICSVLQLAADPMSRGEK